MTKNKAGGFTHVDDLTDDELINLAVRTRRAADRPGAPPLLVAHAEIVEGHVIERGLWRRYEKELGK